MGGQSGAGRICQKVVVLQNVPAHEEIFCSPKGCRTIKYDSYLEREEEKVCVSAGGTNDAGALARLNEDVTSYTSKIVSEGGTVIDLGKVEEEKSWLHSVLSFLSEASAANDAAITYSKDACQKGYRAFCLDLYGPRY